MDRLILLLAQGFGLGRSPVAPGTFGSLLGVAWFAVLVWTGSWMGFAIGLLAGLALSVWASGQAERILGKHDPGSVVLDEITALPLAYIGWLVKLAVADGHFPELSTVFSARHVWPVVFGFALFRLFDVWKPWPIRQTQSLPGGWGVTTDDVLAAAWAAAVLGIAMR
jgi:phosphatidylglycerophosphatase A